MSGAIQIPSIGRVVHFTGTEDGRPIVEPAIITEIYGYAEDSEVDLVVFRALGRAADSPEVRHGVGVGRVEFIYGVKKATVTAGRTDAINRWNWPAHVPATRPEAKLQPGENSIDTGINDVIAFLSMRAAMLEGQLRTVNSEPGDASRAAELRQLVKLIVAGEHVGMAAQLAEQMRGKHG